jgi:biopolymer transport protein ExbD
MLTVMVLPDRYMINDRMVNATELETALAKLAALDNRQMVLIQCINQAPHKQLIRLLDICSKLRLSNLSVVSSGGA